MTHQTDLTTTAPASSRTILHRSRGVRLGPLRGGGFWGVILVVLAYLGVSVPRFGDAYVIDEAVFPYVAQGILRNGAPIFYNGELRPADIGLWHPPLYDYLLAGFVGIFGFSPFSVRAFGSICLLASVFVLFLALRRIAPTIPQIGYVALAALVLLNPLVISGALVPDIDGTLGFVVVALGLWLATVVAQERLSLRLGVFVAAFATLAVATKFTTAGFVALIVGVAALLSRTQRWTKALCVVAGFAVGALLALALLFAAGAIIGFDARLPFDYLFGSLGSRGPGRGGVAALWATISTGPGSTLVWVGPALVIAAVVAAIAIPIRRPHGVDARVVVLAAGTGLFFVVSYAYISASPFQFPKYTPVAVPPFALAATALLMLVPGRLLTGLRKPRSMVIVISYFVLLLVGTAGMFVIAARNERIHRRTIDDLLLLSVAAFIAVVIVSAVAVLLLRPSRPQDRGRAAGVIGSALLIALVATPIMTQASTALVNVTAPYATRYYYGERGMDAFIAQAARIIPADAEVIAAKDVGLQLHRTFHEDAIVLYWPIDEFREYLETERIPYFVTRRLHDYSEPVFPQQFEIIRELYTPVLDNPDQDFVLWELKTN